MSAAAHSASAGGRLRPTLLHHISAVSDESLEVNGENFGTFGVGTPPGRIRTSPVDPQHPSRHWPLPAPLIFAAAERIAAT